MKKVFCDICGTQVKLGRDIVDGKVIEFAWNGVKFRVASNDDTGWNSGDFCFQCVADSIMKAVTNINIKEGKSND